MAANWDVGGTLDVAPLLALFLAFAAMKLGVNFAEWASEKIAGFFGGSAAERVGRAADRAAAARERGDTRSAERHERTFQRELVKARRG